MSESLADSSINRKPRKSIPKRLDETTFKILQGMNASPPPAPVDTQSIHLLASPAITQTEPISQPIPDSFVDKPVSNQLSSNTIAKKGKIGYGSRPFQDFVPIVLPHGSKRKISIKDKKNNSIYDQTEKLNETFPVIQPTRNSRVQKFKESTPVKMAEAAKNNENIIAPEINLPTLILKPEEAHTKPVLKKESSILIYDDHIHINELRTINLLKDRSNKLLLYSIIKQKLNPCSLITFCVNHGADINERDVSCWTVLHEAIKMANTPVIKHLLQLGANPNIEGPVNFPDYTTPFELACQLGNLKIVRIMISYGASVEKIVDGHYVAISFAKSLPLKTFIFDHLIDRRHIFIDPNNPSYISKRWRFGSLSDVSDFEEIENNVCFFPRTLEIYEFPSIPPFVVNIIYGDNNKRHNILILEEYFDTRDIQSKVEEFSLPSTSIINMSWSCFEKSALLSVNKGMLHKIKERHNFKSDCTINLIDLSTAFAYGLIPHNICI